MNSYVDMLNEETKSRIFQYVDTIWAKKYDALSYDDFLEAALKETDRLSKEIEKRISEKEAIEKSNADLHAKIEELKKSIPQQYKGIEKFFYSIFQKEKIAQREATVKQITDKITEIQKEKDSHHPRLKELQKELTCFFDLNDSFSIYFKRRQATSEESE